MINNIKQKLEQLGYILSLQKERMNGCKLKLKTRQVLENI